MPSNNTDLLAHPSLQRWIKDHMISNSKIGDVHPAGEEARATKLVHLIFS